jgi:hypothetical protein
MISEEIRTCLLSIAEQLFSAWAEEPSERRAILLFEVISIGNVLASLGSVFDDRRIYRYTIEKLDSLFTALHDFDGDEGTAPYLHEAQLVAVLIALIKKEWKREHNV